MPNSMKHSQGALQSCIYVLKFGRAFKRVFMDCQSLDDSLSLAAEPMPKVNGLALN